MQPGRPKPLQSQLHEPPDLQPTARAREEKTERQDDGEVLDKAQSNSRSPSKRGKSEKSYLSNESGKRYSSQPSVNRTRSSSPMPRSPRNSTAEQPSKTTSARRPSSKRKTPQSKAAPPSTAAPEKEPPTAANRQERWVKLFEALDTSGDFLIDKQEFLIAAAQFTEACPRLVDDELDFLAWDIDGNGYLTEGEFFCFCDALWQILGEREFQALEAQLRSEKAAASRQGDVQLKDEGQPQTQKSDRGSDDREESQTAKKVLEKQDLSSEDKRKEAALTIQRIERGRAARKQATIGGKEKSLAGADLAEERLRQSMASVREDLKDGRKALRKAINEARSAGVDRQLCDEAVLLVRVVEVEEVLQRAMDSKNPTLLRVAMLNVANIGPDHPMLKEAESLLGSLEVKEKISKALKSSSCDELEAAIDNAESAGYEQSEIDKLQDRLRQMKWKKTLDSAWEKKDIAMVQGLIKTLEEENIEEKILYDAIQMIPVLENYHEAKKELGKAVCTGTTQEVQAAIDAAQKCGVDASEVERARRILRKEEAKEALNSAIQSERRRSLLDALAKAEEYDVNIPEVDIAQKLIKKLDVSRDICIAIDNRDVAALRAVIGEARTHGVDSAKVQKAEQLISQLDVAGYGDASKVASVRMANLHNWSE